MVCRKILLDFHFRNFKLFCKQGLQLIFDHRCQSSSATFSLDAINFFDVQVFRLAGQINLTCFPVLCIRGDRSVRRRHVLPVSCLVHRSDGDVNSYRDDHRLWQRNGRTRSFAVLRRLRGLRGHLSAATFV